ncbi:MAG: phosphate ABC transporter permease PstA [Candidatus Tectomicrobia bacterium]|nr:phosphate ABC transporter permease PstA [Candidatus Tectomicrobia bacterium]
MVDTRSASGGDAAEARTLRAASRPSGEGAPYIWTTSLAVVLVLVMLVGIVVLILVNGLRTFWPSPLVEVLLRDGTRYLGEVHAQEAKPQAQRTGRAGAPAEYRTKLKIGNRDLGAADFVWIDNASIKAQRPPSDALVFERLEYGNFYGRLKEVRAGERPVAGGGEEGIATLRRFHRTAAGKRQKLDDLRREQLNIRQPLTNLEREISALRGSRFAVSEEGAAELRRLEPQLGPLQNQLNEKVRPLVVEQERLRRDLEGLRVVMETANGKIASIALADIVRVTQPNTMGMHHKVLHYLGKLIEFIWQQPRESNTEGGVFPAIFGTVLLVFLMTIAVVPFGVVAAVYMHEYARQGRLLRIVRVAVNNLAGVPSIVIGMFGLAFFVYGVGGTIDQLYYSRYLPTPTFGTGGILWASLTLALLTLPVVIVASQEGLAAVPQAYREASLALGTTKWQTIHRVVLPNATPGILTGIILAISRASGEVAPLMITGVVKLAPSLAIDGSWPFLHLDRKFMHLGFHIYDVAMQSPNVEAAMPMVYSTTALLLLLVLALNSVATIVRGKLRQRYAGSKL